MRDFREVNFCSCGNICEGTTSRCATCNHAMRKADRKKAAPKKSPIKKMSDKKKTQVEQYSVLREAFLLRKWCAVHGNPCIPTQVHHQKGREGFCDDIARFKGIPALLDIRYWIPVCHEAHEEITKNSAWAEEKGFSVKRSI